MNYRIVIRCLCAFIVTFVLTSVAFAASFDCQKAMSEVEKLICGDNELSKLDDSLHEEYQEALKRTDSKKQFIETQRQWLKKERNTCRNTECLKKAYQSRIKELGSLSQEESKSQVTEQPDKPKLIETEPHIESMLQRLNKSEEKFLEHKQMLKDAEKGSLEQIKTLPVQRFDVNVRGPYGRTLLMEAAQSGNLSLVKFLVGKGIDVNAKEYSGRGVLTGAAKVQNYEIVKFLINKGADVNVWFLMYGANLGRSNVLKLLIDKSLDVKAKTDDGKTLLMLAAKLGDLKVVKHLSAAGVDVRSKDEAGFTALMYAARVGNYEIEKLLIDKGADVNVITKNGRTALMSAAERGDLEIAKLLIESGADVNAKVKLGYTALELAQKKSNKQIAELLKAHGAKE